MITHDATLDDFLREALEHEPNALDELASMSDTLEPVAPPDDLRARVMQAAAAGGRLHRFADRVAELLDVSVERAKTLIDGIDDDASWEASPLPGVTLYHLDGGPAVDNAITGFIRIESGGGFPDHTHIGHETVLVLQGRLIDDDGTEHPPGAEIPKDPGTSHSFTVKPGPDLLYLAVVHEGIEVLGMRLGPDDPRM